MFRLHAITNLGDCAALAAPEEPMTKRKTKLRHVIQKLPLRKFAISDNAYACSETLLNPFSGVERDE